MSKPDSRTGEMPDVAVELRTGDPVTRLWDHDHTQLVTNALAHRAGRAPQVPAGGDDVADPVPPAGKALTGTDATDAVRKAQSDLAKTQRNRRGKRRAPKLGRGPGTIRIWPGRGGDAILWQGSTGRVPSTSSTGNA